MTKDEFYKIEKLYHYTSFEKALGILQTNQLWFGYLKDLNDINELYRPMFYEKVTPEIEKMVQTELDKYQQLSLTRDSCRYGFDIPAMWGHYGDKGNGVCFIFNKDKLLNSLSTDIYHDKVEYVRPDYSFSVFFRLKDNVIEPFTREDINEFFFKKTCDWSYEQEYRLLVKTDEKGRYKLPLNDSLIGIAIRDARIEDELHNVTTSDKYNKLKKEKEASCLILNYGNFMGSRHLQYLDDDVVKFGTTYDDTIWCSNDEIYKALMEGKAWIEGTHGK